MCGIIGVLGKDIKNKEKIAKEMNDAIFHRGPDEDGFYSDDYVSLGMRRLSIIDLKTGKQPIESEDSNTLIFFNGEIYNYKELKEDLLSKNIKFKTETDTEVILQLYSVYGEQSLSMLRGMFAFCIYDKNLNSLFIARDHFGIKPLYYLKENNKILAFSSEIKSLLLHPSYKKEVNDEAVFNYLSYQYNPLEETFFKKIFKLKQGHFLKIDLFKNDFEIKQYYSFDFHLSENENQITDEDFAKKEIRKVMRDSIQHHMIADVPVGSFLSGGVDSSIISSLMQESRGDTKIKTFTVGFESLSEGNEAKQTSDFLNTDHTEISVSKNEYFNSLEKVVYHFDEPIADPSAVGLYFVAKKARESVKVVLSGEGSDELFGGYNIYLAPFSYNKLKIIPLSILKLVDKLFDNIPYEFFGKAFVKRASNSIENWYIGNASIFKNKELDILWKGKKYNNFSLKNLYENVRDFSDSTKMQYIDINTWLVGDILAKADKMTMANSLELRVPFLDLKVSEVSKRLADDLKWRGNTTKYILREAFKGLIPEQTKNRRKLGFPVPLNKWLKEEPENFFDIILKNKYINKNFNKTFIESLIENHKKGKDNARKIYLFLMLSIWYNKFFG
jgi:asparagine synthase (glutamine-hydrolysing)